jgi:glycerol-3-phosphate dehydrogenase (NAD(P)+)
MDKRRVSMMGCGAWGSAIGKLLERNGHSVEWYDEFDDGWHDNGPGDVVFLAVPTQFVRSCLKTYTKPEVPVVSLIKGLEVGSLKRVSAIVSDIWETDQVAAISGPTFASEVQKNAPSAAVVASENAELAESIQALAHHKFFRLYRSSDLIGVELGGALKNVYALAGGMCQGLGVGDNGMAALMTRALAEMLRIATHLGARPETLYGLSGMGDLVLTAYSGQSRNHRAGAALGEGKSLKELTNEIQSTIEGVETTRAVDHLVREQNIKAPIVREIYQVLFEDKPPGEAMEALLTREVSEE